MNRTLFLIVSPIYALILVIAIATVASKPDRSPTNTYRVRRAIYHFQQVRKLEEGMSDAEKDGFRDKVRKIVSPEG